MTWTKWQGYLGKRSFGKERERPGMERFRVGGRAAKSRKEARY